ncbi:MAG: SIMPL domain-containing protein [Acidobacteria bacterium]|nr:SIMPL domain-containing protein [Acidobacteriota bacterium]
MKKRILLLAVVALSISSMALPAAQAAESRYITVKAQGTVKVVPDAVRINATATNLASTNKDALSATSKTAAAIRAALKTAKIDSKDIATTSITTFPEYKYGNDGTTTLLGYRATQSFTITVKAANTAGALVDSLVAAGGDSVQINGVSPFVLDSTKATESARAIAVKNAKSRALSYAKLLGVSLGKVNYLTEDSSPVPPAPIFATAKSEADATVVDLGQQDVTVAITVQWSLR